MHINKQSKINVNREERGIVIPFSPSNRKHRVQPCIFCGGTVDIQTFKNKPVCSVCLQHIQTLFLHKRVELL